MPNWQLTQATSRRVIVRLTAAGESSFTVEGHAAEAAQIQDLITDCWVFFNGQPIYRGRVGTNSDTHDGNAHTVQVSTADYRGILQRRLLFEGDTLSYSSVDQAQVAWNLINTTQARTGSTLRILRGAGQTSGTTITQTFTAGTSVMENLDKLAYVANGFDYAINPTATTSLTFDVYSPNRGTDRSLVLNFPGSIAAFSRTVDPGQYANAVRFSGGSSLTPVRVEAADITTRPEGRWDSQSGDSTITNSAVLTSTAQGALAAADTVTPAWKVTLQPDGWRGPAQVWLGDPVTLQIQSGRLAVNAAYRVQEMEFNFDDNTNSVTTILTLGQVPPDRRYLLRRVNLRLTALERR